MGRSRRRMRDAGIAPARAAARPARTPGGRRRLSASRRVLAAYLGGALLIGLVVLVGTVTLGGTLAPWLVLVVATAAAVALWRTVARRLEGAVFEDEDRMLQTMAGGLLILAVGFALSAAVVLTVG